MTTLHIGFGHYVLVAQVASFHPVDSTPIRRMIKKMEEGNKLFDATNGKKQKTVFFTTTGMLILSAIDSKTLAQRLTKKGKA